MRSNVDLPVVMDSVKEAVGAKAGVLIAGQLSSKDGRKRQTWVAPWTRSFLENFSDLHQAQQNLQQVRNNGEAPPVISFYERLEKMHSDAIWLETGIRSAATCSLIKAEVENFTKGFALAF